MQITLAFMKNPRSADSPEMISAYDDITADAWNGTPDFHTEAVAEATKDGNIVREAVIVLPDSSIEALFATPTIGVVDFEPSDAQPEG